jgi:dihydroflavonol-4-reductase
VNGPVLVTGGSGYLGGAIVRRLVADGVEVRALARSSRAEDVVRALGGRPIGGDVLDPRSLTAAVRGCGLVFHAAGVNAMCLRDPSAMDRTNVTGTELVVRAAAEQGVARLVVTSSAASIGEEAGTVGSESSSHRGFFLSRYERSKWLAERRAMENCGDDLEIVVVNPASVQGPGRTHGTALLLAAAADGRLPAVVDTFVSLIDVADCTDGHIRAATVGRPGERYVLSGTSITSRELVDHIVRMTGHRRPFVLPRGIVPSIGALVGGAGRVLRRDAPFCPELARTLLHGHRYDGSKSERDLDLRYTPLHETLRRTLAWLARRARGR